MQKINRAASHVALAALQRDRNVRLVVHDKVSVRITPEDGRIAVILKNCHQLFAGLSFGETEQFHLVSETVIDQFMKP